MALASAKRSGSSPTSPPSNVTASSPSIQADTGDARLTPRMVTIIGVSKDVAGFRVTDVREADVFLPTTVDAQRPSWSLAFKAIPTWRGKRFSSDSPGSIRTWA